MKLRNKQTGKIGYLYERSLLQDIIIVYEVKGIVGKYKSISELCEEWEDYYEKPKDYWYIGDSGAVWGFSHYYLGTEIEETHREIGNLFETKEEAEKAVEKLKAIQRLKDNYFISFDLDFVKNTISFTYRIDGTLHSSVNEERIIFDDMKTIFGGEE